MRENMKKQYSAEHQKGTYGGAALSFNAFAVAGDAEAKFAYEIDRAPANKRFSVSQFQEDMSKLCNMENRGLLPDLCLNKPNKELYCEFSIRGEVKGVLYNGTKVNIYHQKTVATDADLKDSSRTKKFRIALA